MDPTTPTPEASPADPSAAPIDPKTVPSQEEIAIGLDIHRLNTEQSRARVLSHVNEGTFLLAPLLVLLFVGSTVYSGFHNDPYYDHLVGDQIRAAMQSPDPDGILAHLHAAQSNVAVLGLSGASIAGQYSWQNHYDCSVQRTLDYWNEIEGRINDVKAWRIQNAAKATDVDKTGYTDRINAIHDMLDNSDVGCAFWSYHSDTNVRGAWFAHYHPAYYFMYHWWLPELLGVIIILAGSIITAVKMSKSMKERAAGLKSLGFHLESATFVRMNPEQSARGRRSRRSDYPY